MKTSRPRSPKGGLGGMLSRLRAHSRHMLAGGLLGACLAGGGPALADQTTSLSGAPQDWLAYADHVRARIEETLSSDEAAADSQVAWSVVARVWVDRYGTVSRLALAEPADERLSATLQALLVGMPVGAAPPESLRLPMTLRLSRAVQQD
ncbi:hypothetical protein [Chromobacterium sp. IIBBL 290-4]|uniref:hypothetical protein n=1 Tax=Chromobacterium sp. IIBBL 290-4 TaxID=2953890 RepID=UPI0020B68268|nr:hypothetical protein [Chromobacterium sp. IIBBL 290-4]UTH74486.1 hypothetical protein NKT35_23655 [Chromobacterium sp. IIBBL 290-4]